jgi:predicted phage terminase large subunit-like protein
MDGLKALTEAEYKATVRTLCRTDLYFLLRFILNRPDIEKQWLFDRCREVQSNPDGYLDLWAREHYKSTIITYGKTIQDVLATHGEDALGDEITVGIFSHTRPNAKGFLRQIKREFETNEVLKDLFPDILWSDPRKEAAKWSEDDGIVVKRKSNPKEQTIEAWGIVDGQPTGKHFKLQVYDDVVVAESVTTPDMMFKTMSMLELSYNLGAEGGYKRFIGTRYHFNDAYKTITDRGTAKTRTYAATDDGTPDGEPVLLTRERLAEKRRDQGPYTFACQMLQNPVADEAQGFKVEWLKHYKPNGFAGMNVYLLFDPASEKKKTSDYTAAFAVGLCSDQNIRILDIVRDRLNLIERTNLVFKWHRNYKPKQVRYEKYGMQSDIEHIKDEQNRQNYTFPITEVGGQTPKNDRIRRLLPYFEQGRILLPESIHYTNHQRSTRDLVRDFIEEEYKAFPVPMHDDMLDVLARLFEPDLPLIWPQEKPTQAMPIPMRINGSYMGA